MKSMNRRRFLAVTALASAFPTPTLIANNTSSNKAGVNETIRLGFIGLGGRGTFLTSFAPTLKNVRLTALCDPDEERLNNAHKKFPEAKTYRDMRKLFDDDVVDAVVIATCNHWHCLAAIWAMQAGVHAYVEKPFCLSFWEGLQVVQAAKKYDKICQLGTQMRSDPIFHPTVKKFLHEDKELGEIQSVRINRFSPRPSIGKRSTPLVPPSSVDYNLWLGPAVDRPIYRANFHYDWHWMWYTGHGETGNWGAHLIDDCRNDILCDKVRMPKRIISGGARVGYNDVGDTPNSMFVYFDTGVVPVIFCISNLPDAKNRRSTGTCPGPTSGYVAYCEGGRYEKHWGGAIAFDKAGKKIKEFIGTGEREGGGPHLQNFINAILQHDSSILHAPITSVGYDSASWYNGANTAYRLGEPYSKQKALAVDTTGTLAVAIDNLEKHLNAQGISMNSDTFRMSRFLEIDEQNHCFTGEYAQQANALMDIKYRAPFVVPEIK